MNSTSSHYHVSSVLLDNGGLTGRVEIETYPLLLDTVLERKVKQQKRVLVSEFFAKNKKVE